MSAAKVTTDHDEIRKWVEESNGKPASVKGTEKGNEGSGLLRINFPGYSGEDTLEEISWEEFFRKFDESNLAFLYQEEIKGNESRFFKFIDRDNEQAKQS
jgi:hypothetical protein